MRKDSQTIRLTVLLIFLALLVRVIPLNFPFFSADEARIAARGYTLATVGTDELGRAFPLLFNSLEDYQLPAASYIGASGIFMFGKSDPGIRIPFTLVSVLIVLLVYKVSAIFSPAKEFRLLSALIAAFSPALIFLSKIPNETIVLTFGLILLFYLLTKEKANLLLIFAAMVFSLSTAKNAWWTLPPFVVLTMLFFQPNFSKKTKTGIIFISLALTIATLVIFLQVPQSSRSLLENNFPIFQEGSIKAAIDRLRGQGLESGWPSLGERILFNKAQIVPVGFLHWLSNLQPAVLFGQFDSTGMKGFTGMGAFPKALIIPFIWGIIVAVRKNSRFSVLLLYFLILTFPIIFTYPRDQQNIIATALPFLSFIIALGLTNLNKLLKYSVIIFMVLEVIVNMLYLSPDIKKTGKARPGWIKPLAEELYDISLKNRVAVSDDLARDVAPFLSWLTPLKTKDFKNIQFPYRFSQTELPNIKIIGSDNTFYNCGFDQPTYVFSSKRDFTEIQRWLNINMPKITKKVYIDDSGNETAYLLEPTVCVK